MTWRANRLDSDGVIQHAPVANAADYAVDVVLYRRQVGTGSIVCRMLKSPTPARRIVQLAATYNESGVQTDRIVQCASETEEVAQLERLERIIRAASCRPSGR
jgi:hypothetical protein